jgi:hypothetical protein
MWNNEIAAVAVAHRVDLDRWWDEFGALIDRIAPRFSRYEPLRHAAGLALGMVSGLDRKNCGTIAEHRGQRSPDGLQHMLARAKWLLLAFLIASAHISHPPGRVGHAGQAK